MKKNKIHLLASIFSLTAMFFLVGCEDAIDLETETGPTLLVVDGWITNQPGPQTISLTWSKAYFDNGPASPVFDAEVVVTDDEGNTYPFTFVRNKLYYQWTPPVDTMRLGRVGHGYALRIRQGGEEYVATNQIKPVPAIDSLVYREERFPIKPQKGPQEGYLAEFYARDFPGVGDTYWIKPFKNGQPNGTDPSNISLAFDGAFSAGSPSDGLIFILPLRQSITVNGLFKAGEKVGVELHSITPETYYFLIQVRQESANGGIFAVPPANIPTNIRNISPNGKKALGFFGASAVSKSETTIDPKKAGPKE
jgi:hypothetical protein